MRILMAKIATTLAATISIIVLAGCGTLANIADPDSDAPEGRPLRQGPVKQAGSYQESLKLWQNSEDVNAWIGARFEYDMARAMQLSETQRQKNGRMPILAPEAFFAAPSGVCVDLARFAVETLRTVAPDTQPAYLMLEFDPIAIAGNTLRRHWLVSFQRNGLHYYFADSKRPGLSAGPYRSTQEFIADYARYRGRQIVSFREMDSYERRTRTLATRQLREERP